ncbi:hypothetical protein KMT30_20370 [Streptomyces sp. IBSBF 2953]|uniref:hypothetical protein n=1 Tax=Streptomyces TaxID=1883 RepID=UPI00211A6752|nr:hypothetical protein [Streptomyces scabiei]MCQ9181358.1 hypothetical protein [Streptomyces hayashii]MDX3113431.1 hypothetical protein [Streptomyces scabiei]
METDGADAPGRKGDDGGTVHAGRARVHAGLPERRCTLTVVSHRGQQTTGQRVTVAGATVAETPPR